MRGFELALTRLFVTLLAAGGTVLAQSPFSRAETAVRPATAAAIPAAGVGDELSLEIEQDREGAFPKVVSATGEIEVYPAGRVKVAGKTTAEAAAEIKRVLEKDYYYTATIRLSLDRASRVSVRAGQVLLSGEVRQVGSLDLVAGERLTVSQAIMKVGGFREFGDDRRVQVTRVEGGANKKFVVDVKEILKSGVLDSDLELKDGDRIWVPRVLGKF